MTLLFLGVLSLLAGAQPAETWQRLLHRLSSHGAPSARYVLAANHASIVLVFLGVLFVLAGVFLGGVRRAAAGCRSFLMPLSPVAWGCLLALAIGVPRLVVIALVPAGPASDALTYYANAEEMSRGEVYHCLAPRGTPSNYMPAGYPWLLSILFRVVDPSVGAAQLLNVVLAIGLGLLLYAWLRRMEGEPLARAATMLWALLPAQVFTSRLVMSDLPFAFFCLLGGWLAWRAMTARRLVAVPALLGGAAFAMACFVRPLSFFLPLLLPFLPVGERLSLRRRLVLSVGVWAASCLFLVPWGVRNQRLMGRFAILPNNGGSAMWIGNAPNASGGYSGPVPLSTPMPEGEAEQDAAYRRAAVEEILAHPVRFLARLPRKMALAFASDGENLGWHFASPSDMGMSGGALVTVEALTFVYYSAFLALAVVGFGVGLGRRRPADMWALAITAYFALVLLATFANPRYHIPMLPWMAVAAARAFVRRGE